MASQNDSSSSDATTPRVTAAASRNFKQVISVKLDDTNYLQWKQQVEGVLRGTKMVKHVVSPSIPPVFLTDAAREAGNEIRRTPNGKSKTPNSVRGFSQRSRRRSSRGSFFFVSRIRFGMRSTPIAILR